MLGPTLETERLILRPPGPEDFDAFADFMADDVSRFVGGPQVRSAAWRSWAAIIGAWTLSGWSMFSLIEKASGRWVGRAGPWTPDGWPGTEVGWAVIPEVQRMGYGREASAAAIDFAFETLGWTEVIHCIDPANAPSIALAKSLGSDRLRTGVAAPAPIVGISWDIYGQTREAWRARRRG